MVNWLETKKKPAYTVKYTTNEHKGGDEKTRFGVTWIITINNASVAVDKVDLEQVRTLTIIPDATGTEIKSFEVSKYDESNFMHDLAVLVNKYLRHGK